jgi:hypothetical protein
MSDIALLIRESGKRSFGHAQGTHVTGINAYADVKVPAMVCALSLY